MNIVREVGFLFKIFIAVTSWISESLSSIPDIPASMVQMKTLKDQLLDGYDKTIRPFSEGYNSTLVAVGLLPRQILEVDEKRSLFLLDSHLSLAWEDPRLKWNATTEHDGVLQLPADLLWVPNILIHNSLNTLVNPTGEAFLAVLAEGFVTWIPPVHTETSCPALISQDKNVVTCDVKMGSSVHDGWEIDVIRDKHLFLKRFFNINPRWELLVSQIKVITSKSIYDGHMRINFVFPMKRRIPAEVRATRPLCVLLMVLALSIFWLPPNSSKKVLLGGILLIVFTQVLFGVAWSTKYPLTILFADSFIQSTMQVIVITLLLQVLVIFNICKITGPLRPPAPMMRLLKGPIGKITCIQMLLDVNRNVSTDMIELQEDATKNIATPSPRDDWLLLAASMDRLFFMLMSIVVVAYLFIR